MDLLLIFRLKALNAASAFHHRFPAAPLVISCPVACQSAPLERGMTLIHPPSERERERRREMEDEGVGRPRPTRWVDDR